MEPAPVKLATYSPTRGAPSIAVVTPTRALPVIPCDPTPRLEVVPVDQVRTPLDRFRCSPLNATLTARSCIERQRVARGEQATSERTFSAGGGSSVRHGMYMCRECAVGRAVAKAVRS